MEKIARAFCILLVFILLFVSFFHEITAITQDLGRHLLFGNIILQTKSVPSTNLLSYTYPTYPFINHHWLSEVIFTLVFKAASFEGLLILTTTTALAAFLAVFVFAIRKGALGTTVFAALVYLPILAERTDVRPEVFSFLFLSLFMVILYTYRTRSTRWIFMLPFIELLWVNMHISFIVGVIVIGVFLIDGLIKYTYRHPGKRSVSRIFWRFWTSQNDGFERRLCILVVIFVCCIFATILNPNGIRGAVFPFTVLQNYGYSIEENQSIFFLWQHFKKPTVPWFILGVALLFGTLILNVKRSRRIDWFLAIFFSALSAAFIRNFPLFALGTFIPFTHNLSSVLTKTVASKQSRITRNIFMLTIGILVLWHIEKTITSKKIGFSLPKGVGQTTDFFLKNKLEGPIFNNFDIGSQLAYQLYPKEKVFVDGRPEAYPASFFQNVYLPMHTDKKTFDRFVNHYKVNVIVFGHTDQTPWADIFLRRVMNDPDWKLIFLDDAALIFIKNDNRNKETIDRFSMNENSVSISGFESFNEFSLLYLTRLFRRVAWKNQERRVLEQLLTTNPQSCIALRGLSRLEEDKQVSLAYESRYRALCQ